MEFIFNLGLNIACPDDFFCGISLRTAKDMKYGQENLNRLALFKELKLNPKKVYGLNQIHSRKVLVVDSGNPPMTEADGMITNDKSIALSVTAADCLPVILLDTASGAVGIVHSGWKGTGIVIDALNLMKTTYNTNPRAVTAILGPCIGSCCYKVDKERASFFEKEFGQKSVRKENKNFYLDLKAANVKLLQDIGVQKISIYKECTCCDERFGSFRREGEGFTRMMALVGWREG